MVPHKHSLLHLIAHALYIMKLHDSTRVRIYATYYEFKFKKKAIFTPKWTSVMDKLKVIIYVFSHKIRV